VSVRPKPSGPLSVGLLVIAAIPLVYFLAAVSHAAITVPFADHCELIRVIAASYDGTLNAQDMLAPLNHSRPLTYRVIYLLNARLTGWDVRSEYVYLVAAIYATFAVHVLVAWRFVGRQLTPTFAVTVLLIAIFLFSPAGHNNHWWSMMLQLDLASLLILLALVSVAFGRRRWFAIIASAACCWLATYTLTNGFVAFATAALITHVARGGRLARLDRFDAFWAANIALVLAVYLPGLPDEPGTRPGPIDLIWFALIYLGAPVGELIDYPFPHQFYVPTATALNGICGTLLVTYAGAVLYRGRAALRSGEPSSLLLAALTLFAMGSAILTAWGRANFDEFGVANANSSRYTIFGSYLALGLIHYGAAAIAAGRPERLVLWRPRPVSRLPDLRLTAHAAGWVALLVVVVLAARTYERGVTVYRASHAFNLRLMNAYPPDGHKTDDDQFIFPNAEFAQFVKAELRRLRLGPYRGSATGGGP
jgi:hypothetical protein